MSECNIARDLMPLCIDGVASEESRKLVDGHVAKCETCAAVYAEYQKELPAQETKMDYVEAAKALRRWRRMRRMLLIVLVAVLTLGIVAGGRYAWHELLYRPAQMLAIDEYSTRMIRRENGDVYMVIAAKKEGQDIYFGGSGSKGKWVYEVKSPIISRYGHKHCLAYIGTWRDGGIWETHTMFDSYQTMSISVRDKTAERTVYTVGDDIPPASPEYEAYCDLVQSFHGGGKGNGLTDEQQAAHDAQYALVPEFQFD